MCYITYKEHHQPPNKSNDFSTNPPIKAKSFYDFSISKAPSAAVPSAPPPLRSASAALPSAAPPAAWPWRGPRRCARRGPGPWNSKAPGGAVRWEWGGVGHLMVTRVRSMDLAWKMVK